MGNEPFRKGQERIGQRCHPSFNRAGTKCGVCRAVDSALAQTHRTVEVIVVDEGETDSTAECLSRDDERVRYIPQENSGVSGTRNRGIEASHGEYIALLERRHLGGVETGGSGGGAQVQTGVAGRSKTAPVPVTA